MRPLQESDRAAAPLAPVRQWQVPGLRLVADSILHLASLQASRSAYMQPIAVADRGDTPSSELIHANKHEPPHQGGGSFVLYCV